MTARSHVTIRVGLRRIIRDQSVKPSVRMDAIRLLMRVEGLMEQTGHSGPSKDKPAFKPVDESKTNRLRELLASAAQEQKSA